MAYEVVIEVEENFYKSERDRDHRVDRGFSGLDAGKTPIAVLQQARESGLRLRADGNDLYVESDVEPPAYLILELQRQKPAILEILIQGQDDVKSCKDCHHVSRFGNCTIPQRSRLSEKYMLISHPNHGTDCVAYEPRLNPLAQEALALASVALREGAISEQEYSQATQSVHEHADDPGYLLEWIQLIAPCETSKSIDPRGRSF
jgi:hypothetical protein